jgi:lipopolysaccharide export system protein LptC
MRADMNVQHVQPARPVERLLSNSPSRVAMLSTSRIARRRFFVTVSKFLLPVLALALLASIALWPEFERTHEQGRIAFRRIAGTVSGAQMIDPHYSSTDERGQPYTVTAASAEQVSPERINLVSPQGDSTLANGTWLMIQSKQGVYMQTAGQLDLFGDVTIYRDDGTTLHTESASADLKAGAAAGNEAVHAEGPFGVLDAPGFAIVDKGDVIQFPGPANVILNGATP